MVKPIFFDGSRRTPVHFIIIKGCSACRRTPEKSHLFSSGLSVEQNVFSGREAGDQRKLLMDHADARSKRVKRRGESDLLPVYENVSAVAARFPDNVHSEKNLHEGAFTGTVFPDKTENLARLQREVDIREDLVAEKSPS